ncbi:ABC transporter substrate-binding protein [Kaistella jeonii]|uniref:Iron ABC transporter n=1 Tax=Kaistella jeonii TaxID=266749 RepID=A0A0C1F6Y9_9FLAO|nr:helical backbone metal receptor [Kaistella jeonii]KIA88967.1 iron ABC transporter [Kaistella jeonii]SFB97917.1 ABC-type Fe3+-hydroxamate transport system, substrate-binding protein [Kaistella jeonii]VEI97244.1 Vitamin B12-binding protein precursor [Kaistella jeonii]
MKIISLVPSITEALFDFGLTDQEVIGRTKFCIHPKKLVKNVEVIGGTKNLNISKIKSLKPDLIIANKEENDKVQVEELMNDFKVWVTDIETLEYNKNFLNQLGTLLNKENIAESFNQKITSVFNLKKASESKKVAYLIWKNPYMTVGSDTFIHEIIESLGFENLFKDQNRYPEISIDQMKEAEIIFLSTEPFPFQQKHIEEFQKELPHQKIILVDGEAFSWYGTHLAKCSDYFQTLISENL